MIVGFVKAMLGLAFGSLVALVLYETTAFKLGFAFIPFMFSLIITGWWWGFMANGLILRWGTKIQSVAWALLFVISPFSAIYYPVDILPGWAQAIAGIIPTSYIFEGMREVLASGVLDWQKVFMSFGLNLIYLTIMLIWLNWSYRAALNKGILKIH
jgi:ABC-2 type transport system permease protein